MLMITECFRAAFQNAFGGVRYTEPQFEGRCRSSLKNGAGSDGRCDVDQ
jgi:hypothetical protein